MLATVRIFLVVAVCWSTGADGFDVIGWLKEKLAGLAGGAADAAKEKACGDVISPTIDTLKEKLEKQVKDKCKPLAKKSDAAGDCCEKRGKEIATEPADNQQELLMTKCKDIKSLTDVPSKMKEAIEASKKQLQDDCAAVSEKLKGALETCAQEETNKATDKAVDKVEDAVVGKDKEKKTKEDEDAEGKDAKEDKDAAVEEKFELHRLASVARGAPLPAVVALVCVSLVASTAVVMRQRRREVAATEETWEVEAALVTPE